MNLAVNFAGSINEKSRYDASGILWFWCRVRRICGSEPLGSCDQRKVWQMYIAPGNPTPRVCETYGGMLNAIGLQNPGIDVFIERDIPYLKQYDTNIIVNVCGKTPDEYIECCQTFGRGRCCTVRN